MIKNYLKIGLIAASFAFPGVANALIITQTISQFTGDPSEVEIVIDDAAMDGSLKFTISVIETNTGNTGDLRGAWFHIGNEALIPGLMVSGADLTDGQRGPANSVNMLGPQNNLNGGGTPCGCDFGLVIGTPGIGADDIQSTMFVLSHATQPLALALFDGQAAGVRVTSVGPSGGLRKGSSKTGGTLPPPGPAVPEPGTVFLFGTGLAGLGLWRWKTKK